MPPRHTARISGACVRAGPGLAVWSGFWRCQTWRAVPLASREPPAVSDRDLHLAPATFRASCASRAVATDPVRVPGRRDGTIGLVAPGLPEESGLSAVVDVCYLGSGQARAALAVAPDRQFSSVAWSATALTEVTAQYQPGQFWRRELPPLRAVLDGVAGLALIVVDGYVDLDPGGRPGLGARVHAEFGVPVIGIAKTFFRGAAHAAAVCRGRSARPLYVTAAGMTVADAAGVVVGMAGPHRLPGAVRLADRLARGLEQPAGRPATPSGSQANGT